MAYFAQLDENNIVINVIKVDNEVLIENGIENESTGIDFCNSIIEGIWIQTSYNARIRKNYAGIGYSYDSASDAFIPPKPYHSWVLDETAYTWNPPYPRPQNGMWVWREETLSWESPENQQDMG